MEAGWEWAMGNDQRAIGKVSWWRVLPSTLLAWFGACGSIQRLEGKPLHHGSDLGVAGVADPGPASGRTEIDPRAQRAQLQQAKEQN